MAADLEWEFKSYSGSKCFKKKEISYLYNEGTERYNISYRSSLSDIDSPTMLELTAEELGLPNSNKTVEAEKEKILTYLNKLENIALLKDYKVKREHLNSKFKVSAPISYFFESIGLQSFLGIPMNEKLDAVDKVITWLEESIKGKKPSLKLNEKDICALSSDDLGDHITGIQELDSEFKAEFEKTIKNSASTSPKL